MPSGAEPTGSEFDNRTTLNAQGGIAMPLSANPAARAALKYITIGAILDITAVVWYSYTQDIPAGSQDRTWWYVQLWMFLVGIVLVVIGLLVGRIGREAKHADAPPATPADAQATANAR